MSRFGMRKPCASHNWDSGNRGFMRILRIATDNPKYPSHLFKSAVATAPIWPDLIYSPGTVVTHRKLANSVDKCHIRYSLMPHVIDPLKSRILTSCASEAHDKMLSAIFTSRTLISLGMADVKGLKIGK